MPNKIIKKTFSDFKKCTMGIDKWLCIKKHALISARFLS